MRSHNTSRGAPGPDFRTWEGAARSKTRRALVRRAHWPREPFPCREARRRSIIQPGWSSSATPIIWGHRFWQPPGHMPSTPKRLTRPSARLTTRPAPPTAASPARIRTPSPAPAAPESTTTSSANTIPRRDGGCRRIRRDGLRQISPIRNPLIAMHMSRISR